MLAAVFLPKLSTVSMGSSPICSGIGRPQTHVHTRVLWSVGGHCHSSVRRRASGKGAAGHVLRVYCPCVLETGGFRDEQKVQPVSTCVAAAGPVSGGHRCPGRQGSLGPARRPDPGRTGWWSRNDASWLERARLLASWAPWPAGNFRRSFPCQVALVVKNPPANAGDVRDVSLIPGSKRSPGEGNGTPLQYSSLENLTDRGAWQVTVHKVSKSWTQLKQLSTHSAARTLSLL